MATEDSVISMASSTTTPPSGSDSSVGPVANIQKQGNFICRRQRALTACETCHARKVRCDAASLGVPCTNCTAFGVECNLPLPRRNRTIRRSKDRKALSKKTEYTAHNPTRNDTFNQIIKPKFIQVSITDADEAHLGLPSSLSSRVHDECGASNTARDQLSQDIHGLEIRFSKLDSIDIQILRQRGAFLLPPRSLCDSVIDAYFKWVAPIVPVINRSRFMRQYMDLKNPPSLLLLQAILLAGSRVCSDPQLIDSCGSTTPAAMTFYERAKALFDSNYEEDPITIIQALLLIGWYWEGPEDVTKNVYYWTRIAIILAQDSGMHRSIENSELTRSDKRLWKRIWWTLFSRDRSVAVSLGRPVGINLECSDVDMITIDDFIENEPDQPAEVDPDPVHVQFFINYVKLCEIMGLILSKQYSVAFKFKRNKALDLTHSGMALADWFQNCVIEVPYDKHNHNFWAALLHTNYYTVLCLLHRAYIPPLNSNLTEDYASPSRNIAYQAAGIITSIIESLQTHNEIQYTPAFIVCSLFSALTIHVSEMRSSNTNIVTTTEKRFKVCMIALQEVSKSWLVANMVHTLFESIHGGQSPEERCREAGSDRCKRPRSMSVKTKEKLHKRESVDMDLCVDNGIPSLPGLNEMLRSRRPQLTTMPKNHRSRDGTKPATPIDVNFTYPRTPTEMFLITRNPSNITPDLWQRFRPDRLFPMAVNFDMDSASVNPTLYGQLDSKHLSRTLMELNSGSSVNTQNCELQTSLPLASDERSSRTRMDGMTPQQHGNSDKLSNRSKDGSIVLTTLELEDWLNFFGIHGDGTGGLDSLL